MIRTRAAIAITVVIAGAAATMPLVGPAAAAPNPAVGFRLVRALAAEAVWNTYGRSGCEVQLTTYGTLTNVPKRSGTGVFIPLANAVAQISCPDGSGSAPVRLYAPRNPVNDLRTRFNAHTNDLFGS